MLFTHVAASAQVSSWHFAVESLARFSDGVSFSPMQTPTSRANGAFALARTLAETMFASAATHLNSSVAEYARCYQRGAKAEKCAASSRPWALEHGMDRAPSSGTIVAILPCNDLDASERFYNRLGFQRRTESKHQNYRIYRTGQEETST